MTTLYTWYLAIGACLAVLSYYLTESDLHPGDSLARQAPKKMIKNVLRLTVLWLPALVYAVAFLIVYGDVDD